MVFVQPEERVADQKAPHFVAAIIEDECIPVRMLSLPRIGVFVEMRSVEIAQPRLVLRKMCRHPIENHSDPALVKMVYQIHEIRRCSETAGGRKVANRLVTP